MILVQRSEGCNIANYGNLTTDDLDHADFHGLQKSCHCRSSVKISFSPHAIPKPQQQVAFKHKRLMRG
jgi:hypothetical protein